jgi:hypothetical protein
MLPSWKILRNREIPWKIRVLGSEEKEEKEINQDLVKSNVRTIEKYKDLTGYISRNDFN